MTRTFRRNGCFPIMVLVGLLCASFLAAAEAAAQKQQLPSALQPSQDSQEAGNSPCISGAVLDPSGAVVAGAQIVLLQDERAGNQQAKTDSNGHFAFTNCTPGEFQVLVTAPGFAAQETSGALRPGETAELPPITLELARVSTEVTARTSAEIAEVEIHEEEQQRIVLGLIPNFYVSYNPDAQPLNSRQKFQLAWRYFIDPSNLVINGGIAGIQQATGQFSGYGSGAEGYGKRFGAGYADLVSGLFLSAAILPAVLRQDPRYFYKGIGSKRSRARYAIANAFICKGDNRRWQANYSNVLGGLGAAGLSNLYYPPENRGIGLTVENTGIGILGTIANNLAVEFVFRKPGRHPAKDPPQVKN